MTTTTLAQLYEKPILANWDNLAFSDFDGGDYKYGEVAEIIKSLQLYYQVSGIKKGTKSQSWEEFRPLGNNFSFRFNVGGNYRSRSSRL